MPAPFQLIFSVHADVRAVTLQLTNVCRLGCDAQKVHEQLFYLGVDVLEGGIAWLGCGHNIWEITLGNMFIFSVMPASTVDTLCVILWLKVALECPGSTNNQLIWTYPCRVAYG